MVFQTTASYNSPVTGAVTLLLAPGETDTQDEPNAEANDAIGASLKLASIATFHPPNYLSCGPPMLPR